MILKAFSVRQPWAGLLVAGTKRFEVRSWKPRALGLHLVHASLGKAHHIRELRKEPQYPKALKLAGMEDESQWPSGAILGVVEITKVWAPDSPPRKLTLMDQFLCGEIKGMYLWQVGNRWVFKDPIPCHGALNLWTPPSATKRELSAEFKRLKVPVRPSE